MKVKIGNYDIKNKQSIKVRIDKWDTWSLDVTLSNIILPALIRFKEATQSHPSDIEDCSIPKHIETDEEKWDWIT